MYFCVNGRQPYSVIEKADEVKVAYEDREILLDFVEKIPNKKVILEVPGEDFEWNLWHMYDEKFENFCVALYMLNKYDDFNKEGIKWYWPYPITTYYELQEIAALRPSYILLGPPLTFDLENVSKVTDISIRMIPNVARLSYIPKMEEAHGILGQWVRPEDVFLYDDYIDVMEFDKVNLKQEELMLQVYKEDKEWPGNLNLLIKDFYVNVNNKALPDSIGPQRVTCKQRCMSGGSCRLCLRNVAFAEHIHETVKKRLQEVK